MRSSRPAKFPSCTDIQSNSHWMQRNHDSFRLDIARRRAAVELNSVDARLLARTGPPPLPRSAPSAVDDDPEGERRRLRQAVRVKEVRRDQNLVRVGLRRQEP